MHLCQELVWNSSSYQQWPCPHVPVRSSMQEKDSFKDGLFPFRCASYICKHRHKKMRLLLLLPQAVFLQVTSNILQRIATKIIVNLFCYARTKQSWTGRTSHWLILISTPFGKCCIIFVVKHVSVRLDESTNSSCPISSFIDEECLLLSDSFIVRKCSWFF